MTIIEQEYILRDKLKRKEIYEQYIKKNKSPEEWHNINVKKLNRSPVIKEVNNYQKFENEIQYKDDMDQMWNKTFNWIEDTANSMAMNSVGTTSSMLYGVTWLTLTPIAAIVLTSIGVVKSIIK